MSERANEGANDRDSMRCPVCGEGVLADIAYQQPGGEPQEHQADSVEIFAFTCGHEQRGGSLSTSDYDEIDVEHRQVERMVVPPGGGEGGE